jgi:hypothetical protein
LRFVILSPVAGIIYPSSPFPSVFLASLGSY